MRKRISAREKRVTRRSQERSHETTHLFLLFARWTAHVGRRPGRRPFRLVVVIRRGYGSGLCTGGAIRSTAWGMSVLSERTRVRHCYRALHVVRGTDIRTIGAGACGWQPDRDPGALSRDWRCAGGAGAGTETDEANHPP